MAGETRGDFFEKSTPNGAYTVIARTRDDFFDGTLRIEPPVTPNQRYLEVLGDETNYEVIFGGVLVGETATLINYMVEPKADLTYRQIIDEVVDEFLDDLTRLSDPEQFKEIF
jgi:hypothetical protein